MYLKENALYVSHDNINFRKYRFEQILTIILILHILNFNFLMMKIGNAKVPDVKFI
jgi:hypothetical protein